MQTIPRTNVTIPIYYDERLQAKIANACGSQCLSYLTSTTSMPVVLYKPKGNVMTVSQLVLQVCTNGALFGFTSSKGKFIIYYFTSENGHSITVWCQYRSWHTQHVYQMLYDDSFNSIAGHPIGAGLAELFPDSEGRKKFTQFVKDIWQFYQSVIANPTTNDQNLQIIIRILNVQADDGFQYFATMPTDWLSFHAPQVEFERR